MYYSPEFLYNELFKKWEKMRCIEKIKKLPKNYNDLYVEKEYYYRQLTKSQFQELRRIYPTDCNTTKIHDFVCPRCFKLFEQPFFAINCPFPYYKNNELYEWRFNKPSKTLNLDRLWRELHCIKQEGKNINKYLQLLEYYAPVVFKRYNKFCSQIKTCFACRGDGGKQEWKQQDTGIGYLSPNGYYKRGIDIWIKCKECQGNGYKKL